jgi:ribosome maturation protein SDO1
MFCAPFFEFSDVSGDVISARKHTRHGALMAKIVSPQNFKLLTNVAVVRLKKGGKRFEIACYPNTVLGWREGVQKDLSEVLQVRAVFSNVSKGVTAKKNELQQAFGTADADAVCRMILEKGELQLGDKERKRQLETTFRGIATIVAEKCVNPETQCPLTVSIVEKAMRDDIHFSIAPRKSAKQQALEVIRMLKESGFPIERAPMLLRALCPPGCLAALRSAIAPLCISVSDPDSAAGEPVAAAPQAVVDLKIEPSQYRAVEAAVRESSGGKAKLEIVAVSQRAQGDTDLD